MTIRQRISDAEWQARLDLAAELLRHGLHAIADSQHRHTQFKHRIGSLVIHVVHAGMAARKNDALERAVFGIIAHPVTGHIARMDFAIHMGFTDAPRNQLRDLRAKIKDQDFVVLHKTIVNNDQRWYSPMASGCRTTCRTRRFSSRPPGICQEMD